MQEKKFDLIMQLTRVEWLLHKYHQQNHMNFGPMGDPRKGQGRILSILKMKPEISQKDLSYLLEMRPQSLGELLSKLEKKGYISRTPSETDRRVMNIKLTKEGNEATEASEQEFSFDKVFECLNDEEQQNFSNYLDRIIHTLESQIDDEQSESDFDPRFVGGRNSLGGFHNGGRPDERRSDPRHEMRRGYGDGPIQRQTESDKE
ncbi:MarR family winged helix-turn-helix transcriptional regulator [Geosporobacter ferrireducens]|uniref:MarR family winged helix-turn-helix transcriptional regulator n=1 Tax=Geosporobacter ferrireducens TaxID=1424294 RepID=UPI00139CBCF5|nr:MarR family transcriptional regulator [Geosporobacter ferrireducens]MTI56586.1 MarR family transcriptional regulator [Geosporobacter ferrireducens]